MEAKFAAALAAAREQAEALGIRIRPADPSEALKNAKRTLSGRRLSDGFNQLQAKGRLDLSLEALVIDKTELLKLLLVGVLLGIHKEIEHDVLKEIGRYVSVEGTGVDGKLLLR